MVTVVTKLPASGVLEQKDIQAWLDGVSTERSSEDIRLLHQVCEYVVATLGEIGPDGRGAILHQALAVGDILHDMALDTDTMAAAILHLTMPSIAPDHPQIAKRFGKEIAGLVADLDRIGLVAESSVGVTRRDEERHVENLRRMLLALADDIRVVLVVLAERLNKMRNLKKLPEENRVWEAQETSDIYAPLANRLGIWHIKWELEDLCLRYLEPDTYMEIAGLLDGRRVEREQFVADVIGLLQEKFQAIGLKAEITGRPKHIYSIWKKMQRKAVGFDQIFDLRAVRVLLDSEADCYAALGVVHGLWRHIPGEFDDYIATPKANLYRSIHTAVIGPEEKPLEIQIRTRDMHEHAELGVAAHWRYKESGKSDAEFERRITLMRSWLEAQGSEEREQDFFETAKSDFEADRVYVLTPKSNVIELPKGSTALDFAYHIHTEVGHRCRGAKVDGHITQLTMPLESGQMVEILTAKQGEPSRDWLTPRMGYLKTSSARAKVRQWFKHQNYSEHLQIGQASLERELTRLGIECPSLLEEAKRHNYQKVEDLYAAIGRGEISPVQLAVGIRSRVAPAEESGAVELPRRRRHSSRKGEGEVIVEGVGELMTHIARCCKPVPYDPIVGFITRGRGVTVHRNDCSMIRKMDKSVQGRLVSVVWDEGQGGSSYQVDIQVVASDRKGLLRDISAILTNEEVDLTGVNTRSDRRSDSAVMRFTIEITDMEQLSLILGKIAQLQDVLEVKRRV
ncbi:MAG: GTP diphosphokinase [Gammaproteobacteria bacterium]|nr:GTP diphosphokinase [Gammaproteobacteria bacterium]